MEDSDQNQLFAHLKVLMHDVEDLIGATAEQTEDAVTVARERLRASFRAAKDRVSESPQSIAARSNAMAGETENYLRAHPALAVSLTAGAAFVAGFLTRALIKPTRSRP